MRGDAAVILQLDVAGDFAMAFASRPLFDCADERGAAAGAEADSL